MMSLNLRANSTVRGECRPLNLLSAVVGATFFLGCPVKIIDAKISIITFGVRKLQVVF